MMIRRHIIFRGSVQGVGFRWRACHAAELYGCTGWVRNEYDGSVIAEIQGTRDQVDAVVDGLDRRFNGSTWHGGFQIAYKEYLAPISWENQFKVAYA